MISFLILSFSEDHQMKATMTPYGYGLFNLFFEVISVSSRPRPLPPPSFAQHTSY